jgi:hypothetical protein
VRMPIFRCRVLQDEKEHRRLSDLGFIRPNYGCAERRHKDGDEVICSL